MSWRIDPRWGQAGFWPSWTACTYLFLAPAGNLPPVDLWDKAAHAIAFAGLTVLLLLAHGTPQRVRWLVLAMVTYGIAIECIQHFVPGRSFSVLDMVADATGVLAVLALNTWLRLEQRRAA